ncbi:MAG: hypothetical protein LBN20_03950 [Endomicrobium sp.]|nr:hypothetical protein [Endomicrobium sp.]
MDTNEISLDEQMSGLKLGRYETVKLALDWIALKKNDEEYRRLVDVEVITQAFQDIVNGKVTPEAIKTLSEKQQKNKDAKEKEEAKEASAEAPESSAEQAAAV